MNETLETALQVAQILTLLGVGAVTPKLFDLLVTLVSGKTKSRRSELDRLHASNEELADKLRDALYREQIAQRQLADHAELRSRNVRLVNRNRELREGYEHARVLLIRHGVPIEHPYPPIDESTDGL